MLTLVSDKRFGFTPWLLLLGGLALLPVKAADRPPILGVAKVAFQVSDVAGARAFYGDLLGYAESVTDRGKDRRVQRMVFKVNDRQLIEIYPGLPPDQDERLMYVALETTDIQAMRNYLQEKGIKAPQAVETDRDGNHSITITDPDSHLVKFVQFMPGSRHSKARGKHLSKRRISDRLLHVGLTVADKGPANAFYRDILGFAEFWRGGSDPGVTSWVNMRIPDGTDYIEYMLVQGKPTRTRLGSAHHVCLMVPDMQHALETLRERPGGSSIQPPKIGRNNRWLLNIYDQDGTRTELMEPHTVR